MNSPAEIHHLRTALRDLVALFTIPAAWVGRDPPAIAAGLADVLVGLLQLDFAFVRLCDSDGAAAVDVTRGNAWKAFPDWLQRRLATGGRLSGREIIPDLGEAEPYRGVVIPVGVNGEVGLVAAACDRSDFPAETEDLLLRLAANHAATAFQSARLVHERRRAEEELRQARGELEMKVAERTAELRRSEAYLTEAQRLTHTGSYALKIATGEYTQTHSSDEHSRLFGFDPENGVPPFEEFLQRIHPADRARCSDALARGFRDRASFELEFRAVLPEDALKYIRVLAHPVFTAAGELAEFVGTSIDVTERKRAEEERQAQLWFFESMDRINRAIQGTNDLRQMMGDVLDEVLAIFSCDRAWLVYPCDPPDVASHRVRMERTRPECIGAFGFGVEIPNDPEVAGVFRSVLASSGPVRFDPESGRAPLAASAERFSITSMLAVAVYPKVDRPHIFGLHQCSYPRVWTPQEERLFQAVGRRLADALDTLVMLRNLRESERKQEEAQRIAQVGYWDRDVDTDRITWSEETCRVFGLPSRDLPITFAEAQERVHTEDRPIMTRAVAVALGGGARYNVEYRVVRPDGEVRVVHSQGDVMRDESGRPRRMFGTVQDITERKRAEQALEDLAGRLIHAQEEERSRIGRELHDHISQRLGLLMIEIDQLRAGSAIAPAMAGALVDLRQRASGIADDVHRLSHRLHSSTLDYLGLAPALQNLVGEFSARCGIAIDFTHASLPTPLPPHVALCLFRITEESLANIAKHSHARSARVNVNGASDGIHLTVEDDGEGFDVRSLERKAGLGFVSMQERLRVLGGTVGVDSAPSRGTRIAVWVPSMRDVSATVAPEVRAGSN
jgi:PAS domain S-box-containing protein